VSKLWELGQLLIRAGVTLKDTDVITSGDLRRIGRRVVNRAIGRAVHRGSSGLYLKGGKRK
jgi:hypothetical protein